MDVDGRERVFLAYEPASAAKESKPAVFVLHGGGGSAASAAKMTQMNAVADEHGFLVFYPEGTAGRLKKLHTWNAGGCCAYAMRHDVDDVGFLRALFDHTEEAFGVDPKRIYLTGISNGAMMSHRAAIELPGRIAAIAPVVGGMFAGEKAPPPGVSALVIKGRKDTHVPFDGGKGGEHADFTVVSTEREVGFWAKANRCSSTPNVEHEPSLTIQRYPNCDARTQVQLIVVEDGGHSWPGGLKPRPRADAPSQALDASQAMWTFFAGLSKG